MRSSSCAVVAAMVVLVAGCYRAVTPIHGGSDAAPPDDVVLADVQDTQPVDVPPPPPHTFVGEQIVVGQFHSCGLHEAGDVWCWGNTPDGSHLTATPVSGWTDMAEICAGAGFTCGRRRNGTVTCRGIDAVQGDVQGLTNAVQITCGLHHACALRADRTAGCWGSDGSPMRTHEFIDGGIQTVVTYALFDLGLTNVTQVSALFSATCALRGDGTVWCYGVNNFGQLGDGTIAERWMPTHSVVGLSDAVSIAAGGEHVCSLRRTGAVVCWGNNDFGQLGDGLLHEEWVARPVTVLDTPTGIADLVSATEHTCARTHAGRIYCWGDNEYGRLGDGTNAMRPAPTEVVGLTDAVQFSSYDQHTCARRANGELLCWGHNAFGQLGDGTTQDHWTPTPVTAL